MGELRSFETWIQVSIWLLCLGYALGTLARRPERLRVLRGPAARFTTAFALLCCASTLYAYSPLLTLGWSLKLLTCLTMTVAFIDPSEPLRSIRNLLDGTIMGLTFMLLGFVSLGVLSTGDLEYSAAEADSSRLGGTLMSPNELAAVSGLLLVLCLVRLLKRTRNLPSVAGVLIAGTLLMGSVGRGGIIAACLASLVALALYRSTRLALVLAMVIGLILILFPSTVDYGWTAITRGQNPQALGTLNGRFAIWSAAIDLFIERPLLGWGYVSAAGPFQSQFTHMPPANTHNAFLEAATGVGLVGLLLLGAAVVSTAATLIHLLRAGLKSQEGFNTTVALTSIFLCLLIQGIFESSFTGAPRATAVIFFALPFAADQMRSALRPRHSDMTNPGAVRS